MTDSAIASVFFAGLSVHGGVDLDGPLRYAGISPKYFLTAGACQEALVEQMCHLLVVDLDRNAGDALQLLTNFRLLNVNIPKLAIVGHGDIPRAVEAMRAGAANCLGKPVKTEKLILEIHTLLHDIRLDACSLKPPLTKRETTVLRLVLEGKTSHDIARALYLSPRTIEVHRSNIMRKLQATNVVQLVKAATSSGILGSQSGRLPTRRRQLTVQ